jgi:CheY-like chemotaxis protein
MEDTMTDVRSVPRQLLVIDDDAAYRDAVGSLLRTLGHTVTEAESGSAGLALLRRQPVDLVMTDLVMPGLTGWDVARLVKAAHPRLPVVLVTGCAETIPPDQPERTWVDAILAKPCGLAEIQAVIVPLTRDCADGVGFRDPDGGGLTTVRGWQTSATDLGML